MNSLQGAYSVSAPAASRQRAERIQELPIESSYSFRENGAVSPAYDATRLRGVRGLWTGGFSWTWLFYGGNEGGSGALLSSWSKEARTSDGTKQSPGTHCDPQTSDPNVKSTQPPHHPGMVITVMEGEREVNRIRGGCCPGWNGWARLSCSRDDPSQAGIQIPDLQEKSPQQPQSTMEESRGGQRPEEQSQDEKSRESPVQAVNSTVTTARTNPTQEADSAAEGSPMVVPPKVPSDSHLEAPQDADSATGKHTDSLFGTDEDEDTPQGQSNKQCQVSSPIQLHSAVASPTHDDPATGTEEQAEPK